MPLQAVLTAFSGVGGITTLRSLKARVQILKRRTEAYDILHKIGRLNLCKIPYCNFVWVAYNRKQKDNNNNNNKTGVNKMVENCVLYRGRDGGLYLKEELKIEYYEECKRDSETRHTAFWVWLNEKEFVKVN